MAESSVLVVANLTSTSRELVDALQRLASKRDRSVCLVVPAKEGEGGPETARTRLDEAVGRMRSEGLEVEDAQVGGSDPVAAVMEVWDPSRFDAILVSTLPSGRSKWLESDVLRRLEEQTSMSVEHVVATGSGWETFSRPSGS